MRKRSKFDTSLQRPMAVTLHDWSTFVGRYGEFCNKNDFAYQISNALDTIVGDLGASTYTGYSCILDNNPKFKYMGNCVSLKQRSSAASTSLVVDGIFRQSTTANPAPTTCGTFDFASSYEEEGVTANFEGLYLNICPSFELGEHTAQIPWRNWGACSLRKELQQQALLSFIPKLGNGLNLSVFLLEWADTRKMLLKAVMLLRNILSGLPSFARQVWAKASKLTVKELLSSGSNSWLEQVFGVIPFISDVVKAIENVYTFRKSVEKFLRQAGKRRTLHWSTNVPYSLVKQQAGNGSSEESVSWFRDITSEQGHPLAFAASAIGRLAVHGTTEVKPKQCKYTATCDFKYEIGYLGLWPKILLAFEHFGVRLSLADIWEKIPFSFVIDWFYNVGKLLEPLKVENVPVEVVVYDFCDSLKYWVTAEGVVNGVKLYPPREGAVSWDPETLEWTFTTGDQRTAQTASERCYYRLRAKPSPKEEWLDEHGRWVLPTSGWHVITSAALLYQRWV